MAQITTKELGAIGDALAVEETLIGKYRFYAEKANDAALKNQFEQMADRHQRHFDELYSNVK